MTRATTRLRCWILAAGMALALTACGGGGGGSPAADASTGDPPAAAADARNGTYTMVAANAREYALTVDFDAGTFSVRGNGVSQAGTFSAEGSEYSFLPGNAQGATGANTTRFRYIDDTLVGTYATPDGVAPFIAPRAFVTTTAAAAGTYDLISRIVDTTGVAPDDRIRQGRITADGLLEICEGDRFYAIASCPAMYVVRGTLTVDGQTFTAMTPGASFDFHVAQVGADRIFLGGGPSGPTTTRRFTVGMPEQARFDPGTFVGGTSENAWGAFTVDANSLSFTATASSGDAMAMTGTLYPTEVIENLVGTPTAASGNFFLSGATDLGVLFAARGNAVLPGFVAIGVRQ